VLEPHIAGVCAAEMRALLDALSVSRGHQRLVEASDRSPKSQRRRYSLMQRR